MNQGVAPNLPMTPYDACASNGDQNMPTVYQRAGRGPYQCAYMLANGKRKARSTGTRSKKVAIQIAARWEHEQDLIRLGVMTEDDLVIAENGKRSIRECVDDFTDTLRSGQSANDAAGILGKFVDEQGINTAGEFDRMAIIGLLREHLDDVADTGVQLRRVKDHLRVIRKFSEWLCDEFFIKTDYAAKVKPERLRGSDDSRIQHRSLTVAEAAALFQHERYGLWFMFRVWTGLRGTEAKQVRREDIDLAHGTITIRAEIAKNGLETVLPLASQVVSSLGQSELAMRSGLVFDRVPPNRSEVVQRLLDAQSVGEHADTRRLGKGRTAQAVLNQRSFRMTHATWLRMAGLDDMTIGTLRRDRGSGSQLLRRWNYSDMDQLLPKLRASLAQVERWHESELRSAHRCATA